MGFVHEGSGKKGSVDVLRKQVISDAALVAGECATCQHPSGDVDSLRLRKPAL